MLIVQLCDFGADGDFIHRIHGPARMLGSQPGVSVIDCPIGHPSRKELCQQADVVVIQFCLDWSLLDLCQSRRRAGKVTVFEANDYFFDLQPWNPITKRWKDPAVPALYKRLLREADGVQTSTERLAGHWFAAGARDVSVFPNQLGEVPDLPPATPRPITVGWAGSPGHFADWFAVSRLVQEWVRSRPPVRLAVMTHPLADDFVTLPTQRYFTRPFGTLPEYLDFLTEIDIGLAPLLPTEYNRCRSDVKFLEYASRGVVGIYSDLDPYRAVVAESGAGLLYQKPAQIIDALERLLTDPGLRHDLRQRGHDYVRRGRLLADQIGQRLAWYERLLARQHRRSAPTPVGIRIDQGYTQLPSPTPVGNHRDPLRRGRDLIGQGDYTAAVQTLQKGAAVDNEDPEIRNEIGRALYLADDTPAAERELLTTIRTFPTYLPAYEYLLRLHQIIASPYAARFAEQAIDAFPDVYTLVLDATAALSPTRAAQHITGQLQALAAAPNGGENGENIEALTTFRAVIMRVLENRPSLSSSLAMLRAACLAFPESAVLAGVGGQLLLDNGFVEEGFKLLARAADLRQTAKAVAAEFADEDSIDLKWIFSQQIVRHYGSVAEVLQGPTRVPRPNRDAALTVGNVD